MGAIRALYLLFIFILLQTVLVLPLCCTTAVDLPGPGANSSTITDPMNGLCALRSRTCCISFLLVLGPVSQFSLTRNKTPCGFLPNRSSKGENPVEAWGTSRTANNRGSNHLSQLLVRIEWTPSNSYSSHIVLDMFHMCTYFKLPVDFLYE